MQLIDVNILVQAHRKDADHHAAISKWLVQSLRQPGGIAVSELVLSGTLRIITHPKVFREICREQLAWEEAGEVFARCFRL